MLSFSQDGWCSKTSVRKQGLRTQAESSGEWGKISVAAFPLLLMQKIYIVCKDNNCPALWTENCGYWGPCLSSDGVLLKCSELDCRYFGTGQHVQTSSSSAHIKRCVWIPKPCVFNSFICPKLTSLPLLHRCFPVFHLCLTKCRRCLYLLRDVRAFNQPAGLCSSNWTVI